MAATQQPGSPKDDQRDTQRKDVGGDEQDRRQSPSKGDEHPPGMGEDENNSYVPEKR